MRPPATRVRLFLSADLVGSTAFKAERGHHTQEMQVYPTWISATRKFYSTFQSTFRSEFESEKLSLEPRYSSKPRLWKTVGDEVIFCCTVLDLEYLAMAVNSFLRALESYSISIRSEFRELDVKGTGWLAAFQAPNFTIPGKASGSSGDLISEDTELIADSDPTGFDFLGSDMDAGFRIADFSTYDRMAISASLAKCLCNAAYHKVFSHRLIYHGRKALKGVFSGEPYPIIMIDTERNPKRRELDTYERSLTVSDEAKYLNLANFSKSYLELNDADYIHVVKHGEKIFDSSDQQKAFLRKWNAALEEEQMRDENESQAAEQESSDPNLQEYEVQDWDSFEAAQKESFGPIAPNTPPKPG